MCSNSFAGSFIILAGRSVYLESSFVAGNCLSSKNTLTNIFFQMRNITGTLLLLETIRSKCQTLLVGWMQKAKNVEQCSKSFDPLRMMVGLVARGINNA